MLTVVCGDTSSKDSARVISGICGLVKSRLASFGFDGSFKVFLRKKTGGGGQNRIEFKRVNGLNSVTYFVRPFDRDSSWNVEVSPPIPIKGIDIQKAETRDTQPVITETVEPKEPEKSVLLTVGQIRPATVIGRSSHGLNISVDGREGRYEGYIALADLCSAAGVSYNSDILDQYPTGKAIRVVISTIDGAKKKITCSIQTDVVSTTNSKTDFFTGIPDQDGTLTLRGFTQDVDREYLALGWIVSVCKDFHPNPIPHDTLVDWLKTAMEDHYGKNTPVKIDKRAIAKIIMHYYQDDFPCLTRKGDGYVVTDFGWNETKEKPAVIHPLPEHLRDPQVVLQKGQELLRTKRLSEITPREIPPGLDPEDVVEAEVKEWTDANKERLLKLDEISQQPSQAEVTEYIGKMALLLELETQVTNIKAWLESKKHLRAYAERVYSSIISKK